MCDNYCVSQRWISQHWLVDYQYNFSRFWCLCNIFSSELLFTNNGWFFSEPQAMVGTSISFTTLKDLSQKKQSGKRRYATSRKHVDAPDKRGTSGTRPRVDKGGWIWITRHWAAFGTRLRLSCLGLHSVDLLIYSKVSIACVGGLVSWGLPASSSGGINGPAGLLLLLGTHPAGGPPTPTPAGV